MASLVWVIRPSTQPRRYAATDPSPSATTAIATPDDRATVTLARAAKVNMDATSRPSESVPSQWVPDGEDGWAIRWS